MAATTTEGKGPGAVNNIKPLILNGDVKAENIVINDLESYDIDINASGSISADVDLNAGGSLTVDGNGSFGGNVSADGYVRGHSLGQLLNTSIYTFSTGNIAINSGTNTDVVSVSYTPVYNNSTLIIEYHAPYTVNGNGSDDFRSRITVDATEITYRDQIWGAAAGTGTRSSVCLPIAHVYTNSNTTAKTVKVQIRQNTANDTLTVDTNSSYMKITEVSRG